MTSDPTLGDPTQNEPSRNEAGPPPEPRGSGSLPPGPLTPGSLTPGSLTDRSRPNDPAIGHAATGNAPTGNAAPGDPEPEHAAPAHEQAHLGPRIWPRVVGVLILLLGVGGAWIWQNPDFARNAVGSLFPGAAGRDDAAARIDALNARVTRLEHAPTPADLGPLSQRVAALEARPTGTATAADLRPLLARLDALEARARAASDAGMAPSAAGTAPSANAPELDLRPLRARLDALETTVAAHADTAAKVDALANQIAALSSHQPDAELRGRLDGIAHRLGELSANDAKLADGSNRALRLARLAAASLDLEAGHALGVIPDAPPALTRFTNAAPPTEAALRLSFGPAAREAVKVSRPDTGDLPFLDRVIARLRESRLITVREGDRVLLGDAAAATLARARTLLEAGDLAGAARTVATLTGAPAAKMADWLADANALVAAREALATIAAQG